MSTARRCTAGAGTIPVLSMPRTLQRAARTWTTLVRGAVLRRDDLRVPIRVQQSGGQPIHAARTRRGLICQARPPPPRPNRTDLRRPPTGATRPAKRREPGPGRLPSDGGHRETRKARTPPEIPVRVAEEPTRGWRNESV